MSRQLVIGVLVIAFSPIALILAEIVLTRVPQWVLKITAWLCFAAGLTVIVLTDTVYPTLQQHPKRGAMTIVLLAALAAYVFLFKGWPFSLLRTEETERRSEDNRRALVSKSRRMITDCERKYKGGKEPRVSFAEILQRQPAYLELEPYLSSRALSALKADREGSDQTVGKVDGKEFINPPDHLRSILANELNRIELAPDLPSALRQPEDQKLIGQPLDIRFDATQPEFVDPTKVTDERGVTWPCKLYRLAITSHSSSPVTRLLAKGVRNLTEGRTYPPLHLRITGKNDSQKEIRLHKGEPQFWDIVEKKDSERDWARLTETDIPGGHLLRVPGEFMITASCDDGLNVTKRVVLDSKENGDIDFRLTDP